MQETWRKLLLSQAGQVDMSFVQVKVARPHSRTYILVHTTSSAPNVCRKTEKVGLGLYFNHLYWLALSVFHYDYLCTSVFVCHGLKKQISTNVATFPLLAIKLHKLKLNFLNGNT